MALSVGGTTAGGPGFDNLIWRTKNLIKQNTIKDKGANEIILIEHVNDASDSSTFDKNAITLNPNDPIEGYSTDEFNASLLNYIPSEQRSVNSCFALTKISNGKKFTITSIPSRSGNVTIKIDHAKYNIYVTENEQKDTIYQKVLDFFYTNLTDTLADDGNSVDFAVNNTSHPLPSFTFIDTDSTGMTATFTDTSTAKRSMGKYFTGSLAEWSDISKWKWDYELITMSVGYKSSIEMLKKEFPKATIIISMFPFHSSNSTDYNLENGMRDEYAYSISRNMRFMEHHQNTLKQIANFYKLPFLNVFEECGITINNMLEYYHTQQNVHPKIEGYNRFGETVAYFLKKYL